MGDSDIRLSPTQLVAIIVAVLGIGGANYFLRSDPFTGTRGDAHEKRIKRLEDVFSEYVAAEKFVRKQHEEMAKDMKEVAKVLKAEEGSDNRFHQDMRSIHSEHKEIMGYLRKMREGQKDHFREHKK